MVLVLLVLLLLVRALVMQQAWTLLCHVCVMLMLVLCLPEVAML